LQITRWFIKISLVDTREMREILVTRRMSGMTVSSVSSALKCGSLPRDARDLAGLRTQRSTLLRRPYTAVRAIPQVNGYQAVCV